MKTKRLIIILSIIAVFVVVVVLSSTVFTLKKVEINFYDKNDVLIEDNNTLQYFSQDSIEGIIKSGNFKFGRNMFLLKKKPYYSRLESKNPYLKVIDITAKFPDTLVVKVVEREEFYYTNLANNKCAILDGELKLLNIVDNSQVDPYDYIYIDLDLGQATIGEFYNSTDSQKVLSQVKDNLYISTLDTLKAIQLIQSVDISLNYMTENTVEKCLWLDIQTRQTDSTGSTLAGVKISIENPAQNLEDKIYKALVAYNTFLTDAEHLTKTQTGIITVRDDLEFGWSES